MTVTLSALDNLPGVTSTECSRDSGETHAAGKSVELGDIHHTPRFHTTEMRVDLEADKTETATVDNDQIAPTVEAALDPAQTGAGRHSTDLAVSFT